MNGGRYASRGFYLQALVCIFESVRTTSWKNILVEPSEEKVDIEITYLDGSVKVIQVKSTKNSFKPSNIRDVIKSLLNANKIATEYEVVLVGELSANFQSIFDQSESINLDIQIDGSKKIVITQMSLDIDIIENNVKKTLNEYLHNLGLEVNAEKLNMIHGNLIAGTLLASTNGTVLLKEQFNDRLRRFESILNDNEGVPERILSADAKAFIKRRKKYRVASLLLLLIFIIGPIVKFFEDGLNILDIIGIGVIWTITILTYLLFKISDKKFINKETEEIKEYSKNNNVAVSNTLKLQVSDRVEYIKGIRKVYRVIELYNLTNNKIDYIQGDISFYHGKSRIHKQDFSIDNLNPNGSVIVYDNYLVKEKSQKYWSSFSLRIEKTSECDLVNNELHSSSIYRTYGTILNNYYIPIIKELFYFESSWALDKINNQYIMIVFYLNNKTHKRMFIVSVYILLLLGAITFGCIGIYNSLYIIALPFRYIWSQWF